MEQVRIAAVICSYNRRDDLLDLLASLARQDIEHDVFVVDNASDDNTVAAVREKFPKVQVIANEVNLGGAGGFNRGMKTAHAAGPYEYYALFDSDTTLAEDCLRRLTATLDGQPDAGVCGTTIYFPQPPDLIQEIGAWACPQTGGLKPRLSRYWFDDNCSTVAEVDYVAACAYLFRGSLIDEVGFFDERFFIYWDDIDWCFRVRKAGWKIVVDPQAKVWHRGGLYSRTSTVYFYYKYRNRLHFWRTWAAMEQWPNILDEIKREVARIVSVCRRSNREAIASTLIAAVADAAADVWGPAIPGKIHKLAPSLSRDWGEVKPPFLLADWYGLDTYYRYQTFYLVTMRFREWFPDADIHFITLEKPDFELHKLFQQRDIKIVIGTPPSAEYLILPCEHAWFERNNDPGPGVPVDRIIWMDRHGNVARGTEPLWEVDDIPELSAAIAQLRHKKKP